MTPSLTPEQIQVVQHPFGQHARVLAVAGSGKSTTMAHRIKYLVNEQHMQTSHILALMFNNLARKQFVAHLDKVELTVKPPVHTFHSFSFQVIQMAIHSEMLPASTQFWLSDKSELIWLMVKRAITNLERKRQIPYDVIDPEAALNAICLWKGALIPPHRAGSNNSIYLPSVYAEFEQLRQADHILTFDDFIPCTVNLLETNQHLSQRYAAFLQHLIVDEYQDINYGQQRLIELLAGSQADVMVVGDDDQTIYEWRGARPNYILKDFTEVFNNKPIHDYHLSRSFRFGPLIAQCAANLISCNLNRLEKPLIASQPALHGFIHILPPGGSMAKELTDQIIALLEVDKIPPKEIIVLARLYAQLDNLETEFLNRKIPYKVLGQEPFFKRQEIKALLDYLRLAQVHDQPLREASGAWLLNIANKPSRMLSRMVLSKLVSMASYQKWTLPQVVDQTIKQPALGLKERQVEQLSQLNTFLETLHQKCQTDIKAGTLLNWMVDTLDYLSYFHNYYGQGEHADEKKYAVINFIRYVTQLNVDPSTLLEHIKKLDTTQGKPDDELIIFTTIFRTKGLEYDYVALPECDEGLLPYLKGEDASIYDLHGLIKEWQLSSKIENERRLFYVALTRARKGVMVGVSANPSPFLQELYLTETESVMGAVQHLAGGDHYALTSLKQNLHSRNPLPTMMNNLLNGYLEDIGYTELAQHLRCQYSPGQPALSVAVQPVGC